MSRFIDDNLPFTEEEREWLVRDDLSTNKARVALNDRRFGHLSEEEKESLREQGSKDARADDEAAKRRKQEEEDAFHEDDIAQVAPLTMAELRERLEKVEGVEPESDKLEELQLQLLEILDAKRRGTA